MVLAPLAIEAWTMRRAVPGATVLKTGLGQQNSTNALSAIDGIGAEIVVIAGFCGALDPALEPGELVVACELRGPDGSSLALESDPLVSALQRDGITSRSGVIITADHAVRGDERIALFQAGGTAADMESAWLAPAAQSRPLAVIRAVVDTPARELFHPLATIFGGVRALRALLRTGPALEEWALDRQNRVDI